MGVVRNLCETLWKLLRIGIPVAHAAKPAGIHVKHFQAEVRRIADHGFGDLLVDLHPAAPTVIHQEREIGILPSRRVTQDLAHPAPQNISSGVQPAVSRAKKNGWSFENLSRGHASAKRTGIRINPTVPFNCRLSRSRAVCTRPLNSTPTYQPSRAPLASCTRNHGMISRGSFALGWA